ncbi:MAG: ribonuclease J [Clostridia bacterium]|nr:ribonuclease J [Clostridia bacterium]
MNEKKEEKNRKKNEGAKSPVQQKKVVKNKFAKKRRPAAKNDSAAKPSQKKAQAAEQKGREPSLRVKNETKRNQSKNKYNYTLQNKNKKLNTGATLRIIPLGGLQEIGKNMTAFECGDDIVIIDCGMGFPDDDMLGVDLVIPDISYLTANAHKIKGILITHGHEDHIGSIPYVLSQLDVPIYGTKLSLGIIEGKLDENPPSFQPRLKTVEAGDTVRLGSISAEFIHVNHSIADACAIALYTPAGTVFHTGDFKLDVSPIDGRIMDLVRIGEIGRDGVDLLLCESTNSERSGYTPSERTVGSSLERIFSQYEDKRLIIATFSSNVHRVQQIINASAAHGRRVAVLGRSMVNVIGAAAELGYMDLPDGVLIDISEIKRFKPEQITLITTGSQGEPMSALYRIAFSEHDKVKLSSGDVVVLSASAIPGNEKLVGKIINALVKNGVKVVNDSTEDVHVSGHACKEEIKLMMALLKPKYFMPIHGEDRHLYANKEIAEFMGIPSENIFISEIGKVLELGRGGAKFNGTVPSGRVLVDGSGVGDIGSVVLRDRKHLSEDGLVVVVATVDLGAGEIISGPDIVSRGFVYVKESEELMVGARKIAAATLERALARGIYDFAQIKMMIRDDLGRFITKETKRKPMILPVIMDI